MTPPTPPDRFRAEAKVPERDDGAVPAVRGQWAVGDVRPLLSLPEAELHLRDYIDVLLRHRWTVLSFLAAVVLTTAVVTLVMTPVYRSTVLIEIGPQNPNVGVFQDVVEMARSQREFFRTQYDVLRSRNLAARVIDRLELASNQEFLSPGSGTVARRVQGMIGGLMTRGRLPSGDTDVARRQELVERFIEGIDVTPRRHSYLVEVSFTSQDPALAQRIANAVAEEYVALSLDQRLASVRTGRGFIERQLAVSRAGLERAEEKLQQLSKDNAILVTDDIDNIEYRRLADLNEALTVAQRERMAKEALLRQAERGEFARVSAVVDHPVVNELFGELARDEAEYSRLSKTFTAAYPAMQRLKAKIDELRDRVEEEIERLSKTLRADYEAALKNEQLLQEALAAQKAVVSDLNERTIDYKTFKRQVDTDRDIYRALLQRLQEVEVTEGIRASNIHVIDAAPLPFRPYRPRPIVNLALALLVGLAGGIGLAFFQEYLDSSIKTPEDVERHLHLGTLGALPTLRVKRNQQGSLHAAPELIAAEDPQSVGAEAMRTLRAALFLATAAGPPQRILVTSARPEEGKTCVAVNLAIILAQMGKRVVLMDTDLRRPRVHRIFGREIAPGLTNFLAGNSDLPSLIQPALPDKVPNLDLVVSGPIPPNPVDLIDSMEMKSVLDELCRRYDFVVADGPPSLGFADVPLLSREMGGILLVVKCGETPRKVVKQAADFLTRLRAKVLGVILNQVNDMGYGYYYSYYRYSGTSDGRSGDDQELLAQVTGPDQPPADEQSAGESFPSRPI